MRFMVLGGVAAMRGARRVDVGGGRQRALLALLLIHSGEVVSRDRLIDALWAGEPPASASRSLHAYVARLRRAFREVGAEGLLQTRAPGYVLQTGDLDATRVACLAAGGREAGRADDAACAVACLDEALALWHGAPFAPVADEPWARDEVARLEELRLGALEDRIDAELSLGRHAAVTADLDRLASQHPGRERLLAHRMLALYRCGRQADALAVYREAHRRLVDDYGLEPGPRLRRLQSAVLHQDPSLDLTRSLDPPAQSSDEVERRHGQQHRTVAAAAIVVAAIAVAVIALGALREPTRGVAGPVTGPALVKLSATSARARAVMALDGTPSAAASGDGSLWLADPD